MTVPEAVNIARKHLVEVIPGYSEASLQLEELETPPFGSRWSFTFSTSLPIAAGSLAEVMRGRRVSKSVEIDSESGLLIAVKNAAV